MERIPTPKVCALEIEQCLQNVQQHFRSWFQLLAIERTNDYEVFFVQTNADYKERVLCVCAALQFETRD